MNRIAGPIIALCVASAQPVLAGAPWNSRDRQEITGSWICARINSLQLRGQQSQAERNVSPVRCLRYIKGIFLHGEPNIYPLSGVYFPKAAV